MIKSPKPHEQQKATSPHAPAFNASCLLPKRQLALSHYHPSGPYLATNRRQLAILTPRGYIAASLIVHLHIFAVGNLR